MAEAKGSTTFRIGGEVVQRIRYGEEKEDWGAGHQPCHDCGVTKVSYTFSAAMLSDVHGAEVQAKHCECPYDDGLTDEPRANN